MGVNPQAQAALDALFGAWGQPLPVISAYRDPAHNARVGGAKNSQHTHGNAFDIDVSGLSYEQRVALAEKARAAGFSGFGFYDTSMHFDIGPARYWGPSYGADSTPSWAMPFVQSAFGQGAAGGGGGGVAMATSSGKTGGGPPPRQAGLLGEVERPRPSIWDALGGRENIARLAMSLDGMTLNPNAGLQASMAGLIKEKQDARAKNATAEFFIRNGRPELAEALMAGGSAASLMQHYLTKTSSASAPDDALAAAKRLSEITGLPIDSPMIQAVILNGGEKAPANFLALHAQAQAAGLEVGSPEYEQFMLTRGAGDAAEAKAVGTARGEASAALPGMAIDLRSNVLLVDELLADPALDSVVGPVQGALPNISPGAVRVQSKINQLLGKAYLAAREELRGTGQITEKEADEARNAYTRLQNLRMGDDDYREALLDFKRSLNLMLERSTAVATGAAPATATQPSPSSNRIRFDAEGNRLP